VASRRRHTDLKAGYAIRAQACLAAALLFAGGLVNLWPLPNPDDNTRPDYRSAGQETIEIEEIVQTRQRAEKPPPPPPILDVVVSDEEIDDDLVLDLPDDFLAFSEDDGVSPDIPEAAASGLPDLIEPRPVRIVEPEYTREAQRKKIRAEVVVEVLVDERGRVNSARVLERFLLGKDEERLAVGELGYGLEESAIDAARRCMFRPARFGGETVRGYKTLRFSFGV